MQHLITSFYNMRMSTWPRLYFSILLFMILTHGLHVCRRRYRTFTYSLNQFLGRKTRNVCICSSHEPGILGIKLVQQIHPLVSDLKSSHFPDLFETSCRLNYYVSVITPRTNGSLWGMGKEGTEKQENGDQLRLKFHVSAVFGMEVK